MSGSPGISRRARVLRHLTGILGATVGLLLIIWVGFEALPESSGIAFGLHYQIFYTGVVLSGAAFFWLLRQETVPHPKTALGVLASVALVYAGTVGLLMGIGIAFPQFQGASPSLTAASGPVERGYAIFWNANPGCFLCHAVDGAGGIRGPDLSNAASIASERVAGLEAEGYLRAKIKAGLTYEFTVPEYTPIMPPFGDALTDDQISDIIAYLTAPR